MDEVRSVVSATIAPESVGLWLRPSSTDGRLTNDN